MMKLPLVASAAFACCAPGVLVFAFPSFMAKIPNCDKVHAVGHENPAGGGALNSFGMDFEAAGLAWTAALCQKDSDADGRSNGEELGDPNCTWTPGSVPERTTGITHPGVVDKVTVTSAVLSPPYDLELETGIFGAAPDWYLKHAVLMLCSWLVIMPIGILVPVIFKDCSKGPLWFHFHRLLMMLGLAMCFAGLAVASYNTSGKHFVSQHSLLGLASIVLAALQPLSGLFRPHAAAVKTSLRLVWEFCHQWLGRLAILLAAAAAVTGIQTNLSPFIGTSRADAGAAAVAITFVFWVAVGMLVKLVLRCRRGPLSSHKQTDEEASDDSLSSDGGAAAPSY
ncbi:unnamed protein product [Polarella glacialis]|uniref:Cytochrome b561 domain-containing protein n=1 Tax=Polarella glacialis TaxID=89957 RepID=A0A813ERD4_POLGL|nr:unnamed protein product [Polarella glacialis]CAE8656862.1 unnamed protein product [Polarella glacialis]